MTLPHLPLVHGALLIDNSWVELFCNREKQYVRLEKIVKAGVSPALNYGSCIHACHELRYTQYKNSPADAELDNLQGQLITKWFQDHPQPDGDHRTATLAIETMQKYNMKHQVEPWTLLEGDGKVMVEVPFMLKLFEYEIYQGEPTDVWNETFKDKVPPLTIPVFYTGRIDLPVSWDGQIIIVDHKTTYQLGQTFSDGITASPQLTGYAWAFQELTGLPVAGVCVNAIRSSSPPAKPRGGIDAWWDEQFGRYKEYIYDWQIKEWKENTIRTIETFLWQYGRGFLQQDKVWCVRKWGKCQFYDICNGTMPENRAVMLKDKLNFMENVWSPLKH